MLLIFQGALGFGFGYDFIEFDATLSEVHVDASQVTEHPIESGAPISDYVLPANTKLTVEGFITNTPIESTYLRPELGATPVAPMTAVPTPFTLTVNRRLQATSAQVAGGWMTPYQPPLVKVGPTPITTTAAQYLTQPLAVGGMSYQFPQRVDRVREIYSRLKELQQAGTPIEVVTQLAGYPAMIISSLSAPRVAEDAITISLELTQITSALTAVVSAVPRKLIETNVKAAIPAVEQTVGSYEPDVADSLRKTTVAFDLLE